MRAKSVRVGAALAALVLSWFLLPAAAFADPDDDPNPDLQSGEFDCALQIGDPSFWGQSWSATVTVEIYADNAGDADPVARSLFVEDPPHSVIISSQCTPSDNPAQPPDPTAKLYDCLMVISYEVDDGDGDSYTEYATLSEITRAHNEDEAADIDQNQTGLGPYYEVQVGNSCTQV